MPIFTYVQVGLLDRDEPIKTRESWWGVGKYRLRRYVYFTLIENDKLIKHEIPYLTGPELFNVMCDTILDADKTFEKVIGFRVDKPYGSHTIPVVVTIS